MSAIKMEPESVGEQAAEEILKHYGVKGMKWGVRRTQEQLDRASGRKSSESKRRLTATQKTAITLGAYAATRIAAASITVLSGDSKVASGRSFASKLLLEGSKNLSVAKIRRGAHVITTLKR